MPHFIEKIEQHYHEPERCAEAQGLIYCLEHTPGYLRKHWGRGFRYFDAQGNPVTELTHRERLQRIAAPPAWKNVWLAPADNFHILAHGEDEAGRKQYAYHPKWSTYRNRLKYYHLLTFAQALPSLRRKAYQHLQPFSCTADMTYGRVLALMILLLDKGALRIGSETYYEQRETVGLTTLLPEHVQCKGSRIELCYLAKSGKERCIQLRHKRLSQVLQSLLELATEGEWLFRYVEKGESHHISRDQLNHTLKDVGKFPISAKDFRTWKGTLTAYEHMVTAYQNGESLSLKAIAERVAEALGNTPAIAQQSYIHGDLLQLWQAGDFADYYESVASQSKRKNHFSRSERELSLLLEWLFETEMSHSLK